MRTILSLIALLALSNCGSSYEKKPVRSGGEVQDFPFILANDVPPPTCIPPDPVDPSSDNTLADQAQVEPTNCPPPVVSTPDKSSRTTDVKSETSVVETVVETVVASTQVATIAGETKALKLTDPNCIDPLPAEIKKGVKFTLCNGTLSEGTMEQTVTEVVETIWASPYGQCTYNGQTECLTNPSFHASNGVCSN